MLRKKHSPRWRTGTLRRARSPIPQFPVTNLNNLSLRVPPVVPKPTKEAAASVLNWLSATGTGILLAAILSGMVMDSASERLVSVYGRTIVKVRFSLLTIAAMLAIGMLTRYSDSTRPWDWRLRARPSLSIFWNPARLARSGSNRVGHFVECPVRQSAENFGAAGQRFSRAYGSCQHHRRRDGQDD